MKKVIFSYVSIAIICLGLQACGGTTETKTETTTTQTTTTTAEKPATETTAMPEAPTFSSDEVNKGIADYRSLIDNYLAAIEQKDMGKISAFNTQYQTTMMNMSSWATKLKPDEAEKFSTYMKALGERWKAAAEKMGAH
jgi:hypothetical protein